MTYAEYLKEEIAHCERLARSVFDEITSEWLLALARECRNDLVALAPAPAKEQSVASACIHSGRIFEPL